MAKGKYIPEIVEEILFAIGQTGRDLDGIKAGGISTDTFYRWHKEKSEFSEAVAHAKAQFRARLWKEDPQLIQDARDSLHKLVKEREETWVKKYYTKAKNGKLVLTSRTETTTKRGPSAWAISAVLDLDPKSPNHPGDNGDNPDGSIETVDFDFEEVALA